MLIRSLIIAGFSVQNSQNRAGLRKETARAVVRPGVQVASGRCDAGVSEGGLYQVNGCPPIEGVKHARGGTNGARLVTGFGPDGFQFELKVPK
jgi:hypothetical protein